MPSTQGTFGRNLQAVAQMIKLQLRLRVATVDLGGWDTHEYQGDAGTGYFAGRLGELATSLEAFMIDLSNDNGTDHTKRLTVVVMSEFNAVFRKTPAVAPIMGMGMSCLLGEWSTVEKSMANGRDWPPIDRFDRRDLAIRPTTAVC